MVAALLVLKPYFAKRVSVHKHRQSFFVEYFLGACAKCCSSGAQRTPPPSVRPPPPPFLWPACTRLRQRWRSHHPRSCWNFSFIPSVSSSGCYGSHLLLFPRVHHSFDCDSVYLLDVGAAPPPRPPLPTASLACAPAFIEADIRSRRKVPWDAVKRDCHPPSISPIEYKQTLICSPSVFLDSAHLAVLGPILPLEETLDGNEARQRI